MSFSSEQKEKIINDQYKNACCRRALLSGILSVKATVDSDTVSFSLEKESYCEFSAKLISEFYGKAAKIESPRRGGRCKNVSFESKVASKYVRTLSEQELPFVQKCPMCASSYMKGVFLGIKDVSHALYLKPSGKHPRSHKSLSYLILHYLPDLIKEASYVSTFPFINVFGKAHITSIAIFSDLTEIFLGIDLLTLRGTASLDTDISASYRKNTASEYFLPVF